MNQTPKRRTGLELRIVSARKVFCQLLRNSEASGARIELDGRVANLVLTERKPFDVLVEGRFLETSGEGGIRTPGEREPTLVFETSNEIPEPIEAKRIAESGSSDMVSGMVPLDQIPADLLPVVNAWPDLPEHLKAAILTLVNIAATGGKGSTLPRWVRYQVSAKETGEGPGGEGAFLR